jgi:hypothetical protein
VVHKHAETGKFFEEEFLSAVWDGSSRRNGFLPFSAKLAAFFSINRDEATKTPTVTETSESGQFLSKTG